MATFGSDTFTGTNGTLLTAHASDSGHSWVVPPGQTTTGTLESGAVWDGGNNGIVYLDIAPASADYSVQTDCYAPSGILGGPAVRVATGANTCVSSEWNGTDWVLFELVAGVFTSLGTYTGDAPSTLRTVTIEGSGTQVRLLIGGVERIAPVTTGVVAAGRPGMNLNGNTSANYLDNFVADQVAGGVTSLIISLLQPRQIGFLR